MSASVSSAASRRLSDAICSTSASTFGESGALLLLGSSAASVERQRREKHGEESAGRRCDAVSRGGASVRRADVRYNAGAAAAARSKRVVIVSESVSGEARVVSPSPW